LKKMKKLVITGLVVISLGFSSSAFAQDACCSLKDPAKKSDSTAKITDEKAADILAQDGTLKDVAPVEAE